MSPVAGCENSWRVCKSTARELLRLAPLQGELLTQEGTLYIDHTVNTAPWSCASGQPEDVTPVFQLASVLMSISRGGTSNQGRVWGCLGLDSGSQVD